MPMTIFFPGCDEKYRAENEDDAQRWMQGHTAHVAPRPAGELPPVPSLRLPLAHLAPAAAPSEVCLPRCEVLDAVEALDTAVQLLPVGDASNRARRVLRRLRGHL
jgi:hypothetical protein